eukprot:gene11222-14349_t
MCALWSLCGVSGGGTISQAAISSPSVHVVRSLQHEMATMGTNKTNFVLRSKFFHTLLHLKLCGAQPYDLLCTTASGRVIYGRNIDTAQMIFHFQ